MIFNQYRKKNVIVTAVQYDGDNFDTILEFTDATLKLKQSKKKIFYIEGEYSDIPVEVGDWVINELGQIYTSNNEDFEKDFELMVS